MIVLRELGMTTGSMLGGMPIQRMPMGTSLVRAMSDLPAPEGTVAEAPGGDGRISLRIPLFALGVSFFAGLGLGYMVWKFRK